MGSEVKTMTVLDAVEKLTADECLELLSSRDLGRIALVIGDQPEIFPVNYAVDRSIVIFRVAPGTKPSLTTNHRIAFEVDELDSRAGIAWSVVVKGTVLDVTSSKDPFTAFLRTAGVRTAPPGDHPLWMAIYPSEISGRRFRLR
ncbi:MAG TPA: pyridoxamine 5'-phosphate oxidase family protein [Candidatus Angelobacter sp.]|jgi:nitroimidazol reductase NimA-like FMN-containing flavoprotein (pyridoxamine 5'-phosphate oxidase superfamily)|nr:pyridoxamine 5'-phosphate oxidase family protein [Candidatus Angelobacter sp.]